MWWYLPHVHSATGQCTMHCNVVMGEINECWDGCNFCCFVAKFTGKVRIRMSEIGEAGPGEVTVFMNINWFYLMASSSVSLQENWNLTRCLKLTLNPRSGKIPQFWQGKKKGLTFSTWPAIRITPSSLSAWNQTNENF